LFLLRLAYKGLEQAYGRNHTHTLSAALDLAECLQELEEYADAEVVYRFVLLIC